MTTLTNTAAELLAESVEWRLLGLLFACPQGDWRRQLAALTAEVRDDRLKQAAQAAVDEAEESVYHTVFGPGGPAAPREVSHRQSVLSGQYLAELLACYQAFAYCPPREEPPDHIATEIDLIAYLRLKQAFALAGNDGVHAAVTAEAVQQFIDGHLATTAVPLARILESSGIRYLALAAAALVERIGGHRTKAVTASRELDQVCHPALPICEVEDCCADFSD